MAKQNQNPPDPQGNKDESEFAKVRMKKLWTGKRGVFAPGCIVELPLELALSLEEEGAAEILQDEAPAS